ncbi:MAG: adenylate/guanylate cyclase domain-containing protein [Candidatus Cloacimonadaceae bacterium]|jgi:PAS domain S-box-containing protein|nr:adenylate/guanylate cyclase domain-containing protein [Candidatus Cloacimonadota bacterium]MDD4034151.1 adenylate/guanylate cyclase domain-containing protein [Candidatus Cloacimonadota bacterium]MDY0337239.1 adenylate/guanylate cyclase domain-containing protein [Candidatus Cloacimonadaceae bacterium]
MKILEALSNPSSQLRVMLDSLYDGVYIVDPDRIILYWNKAAEELTGYSAEEVIGKSCRDDILNHIDENGVLLCRGACPLLIAMRNRGKAGAKVYPKHKCGRRFPVETHVSTLLEDDGSLVGAIEVFRDISHQEDYRILQEKFNNMLRKYVSEATYSSIEDALGSEPSSGTTRLVDMSVLYLDVVNFTGYSESNPPMQVVKMLNDLFGICEVVIREHYGDIDKFIGDAIMAVFHDASDAVRAGIKILQEALVQMNSIRLAHHEPEIQVRIGINSGLLLQGDVGTDQRRDLTVIGDTVNVAARVEKAAIPGRLMISEACLARLGSELVPSFQYHHSELLKGKTEEIKLYLYEPDQA